jgi:MFS transporter, DHA2 family, multidrug resistance protein
MSAIRETAPQPSRTRRWAGLVVLMLPVLLIAVDGTVLNFALPEIATQLSPSGVQQLWIVDAYPLALAGLLVTMGSLGDRLGRRRLLLIGVTGFTAVSVLAAFAPSAGWLIAARVGLGLFGAMLMPSTLSLLRTIFRDRDERRLAIAIWASGFAGGAALGPIVGGVLLEHFAWGSVFLLAVPVMIPLLVLAPMLVPESSDPQPGPIDPVGILLSIAAMAPLALGIKELAVHGPSAISVGAIVLGVAAAALFVRRQLRARAPMLDMALFRDRRFSGAILVNLTSILALSGFLYFVSQHLQLVLGLAPLRAAVALIPELVAVVAAGLLVVPIARRVSPRLVIPVALAFTVSGYLLVAFAVESAGLGLFVTAAALVGFGIGAAETVSNELILSSAPASKAGAASAVSETAYEFGTVLGTTVLGGILTAVYRATLDVGGLPAGVAEKARETLAGALHIADGLGGAAGDALRSSARQAFMDGSALTALAGAALVVGSAVIAITMLRGDERDTR